VEEEEEEEEEEEAEATAMGVLEDVLYLAGT
jgi:hypothetical protein